MLKLARLSQVPGLRHGFSTRKDGNQSFGFDDQTKVIRNRRRFIRSISKEWTLESCVGMVPMRNGYKGIAFVNKKDTGLGIIGSETGPFSEAMITTCLDVRLFLTVADCIPVIIYDPHMRVLALIHAGRQSSVDGITRRAVESMVADFRSSPENLIAGLGPGIRRESYLLETFAPADQPDWREFCDVTPGGARVDLFGYNKKVLVDLGVSPNRIEDCGIDTFADRKFFSHRRSALTGEKEGRQACVVGMVEIS